MYVKQISAFLENHMGALAEVTHLLGRQGLDLIALSIADTRDFGILRAIVGDYEKARAVLQDAGYAVSLNDVLAVCVPDRPGGLGEVLSILDEADISVEYLYSFVRSAGEHALIILRVEELARARDLLLARDVKLLDDAQVRAL